jgi:hypothetical protein
MKPNFSKYSESQLRDVLRHIDKRKFPERVDEINELLRNPVFIHNSRLEAAEKQEEKQHNRTAGGLAWVMMYGFMLVVFGVSINRYGGGDGPEVSSLILRYGLGLFCLVAGAHSLHKHYKTRKVTKR